MGTESTFKDLEGSEKLREKLKSTAVELEEDLGRAELMGRTVNLKVKLHSYEVYTRQKALHRPIHLAEDLYNTALPLLQALEVEFKPLRLRLIGLRMTQLVNTKKGPSKVQEFFKNAISGKRKLEEAEGEWEVWPEEEFAQMKAASGEKEEDILLLSQREEDEVPSDAEETGIAEDPAIAIAARTRSPEPPEEEKWSCPICTRSLSADDALFNEHVDFCLSRETIKEAVRGSTPDPEEHQGKKQQLQRPQSQGSGKMGRPSDKKRKSNSGRQKSVAAGEGTMRQYFVRMNE